MRLSTGSMVALAGAPEKQRGSIPGQQEHRRYRQTRSDTVANVQTVFTMRVSMREMPKLVELHFLSTESHFQST
jgi:hypothetical protein